MGPRSSPGSVSPESRFRVVAGEGLLSWYRSTEQSRRGFCSTAAPPCSLPRPSARGNPRHARFPGRAIDREPQLHCFYDQHVDWATVGDSLARYDTAAEGLAKYRAVRPRE